MRRFTVRELRVLDALIAEKLQVTKVQSLVQVLANIRVSVKDEIAERENAGDVK